MYLAEQNIYGSARIGTEEMNERMLSELPYDYLPLDPIIVMPSHWDLYTTTGMWYYEVQNTSSTIVDPGHDGVDDICVTNADAGWIVYSAITTMKVEPGQEYTLSFDYTDRTNSNILQIHLLDLFASVYYIPLTTITNYQGKNSYTFTLPPDSRGQLMIKWYMVKANQSLPSQFTLSKISLKPTVAPQATNTIGDKRYELANHLGNVLNVVSDRKIAVPGEHVYSEPFNSGKGGWEAYAWEGLPAPATNNPGGLDGQLDVSVTAGQGGVRRYFDVTPGVTYTLSFDFECATGIPIRVHRWDYPADHATFSGYAYNDVYASGHYEFTFTASDEELRVAFYSYSNTFFSLDNISITGGITRYAANVLSYSDYYAFGMLLPGRHEKTPEYRYGFQGQEKDDEVKGAGNSYDFGARIYDPRVGRWLSRDANEHNYPNLSPYNFSENSPMYLTDSDGNDAIITIDEKTKTITVSAKIYIMNDGKVKLKVSKVQKAVNKYWSRSYKYKDGSGTEYNVKFDIQVKEADHTEDPNDASKNWVRPKESGFRSYVEGFRKGNWAIDDSESETAHEIGHMLGLADQYVDIELDPELNYQGRAGGLSSMNADGVLKNELMGTAAGDPKSKAEVSQRDIDAIAKYALDRYKKGKHFDGKVILDQRRLVEDGYILENKVTNGLAAPTRGDEFKTANKASEIGCKIVEPHKQKE